ncbi:MAG: hypothetical protein IJS53_01290 [Clostridia bacterium]|nr:hypothetical protein [Clostridia bacterium]
MITGKSIEVTLLGKHMKVWNQRCRQWDHPYDYRTPQKATLSTAGCGVFSVCHCGQWLTGKAFSPDELAEFSMANGGRGDDGTDRPALLSAMMEKGLAARFGFRYDGDGLRNDRETLRRHLLSGSGVALCTLRAGHIVALVAAREIDGEFQSLVIDPYSETLDARISPIVREVIEESEIISAVRNERGALLGYQQQFAAYWVSDETVRDFNLLYAL